MKNGPVTKQAVRVTIIYLIASALYTAYSYNIVHDITHDPDLFYNTHTYTGIALAILTSLLIFFLVLRILKKQQKINILYRDSNEYFSKVFENAPTGIAIVNWDGTFDQCNPAFCRMLGYTADEIKSLNFRDLLFHEDQELNLQQTNLLKSGQMQYFELESRYLHKSGNPVWSHKYVTLLPGKEGSQPKVLALVTDISGRKLAEERILQSEADLKRSSRFFEQLYLQSATSTQLLDADGWCVRINPKLSTLFGVKPEDIEGKKYNIFEDGEVIRTGVIEKLIRVFENRETISWEVEFDIEHSSKTTGVKVINPNTKWFFNKAYPILDDAGNLENVIIQHEDITERIQMEQKILNTIIQTEELERKRIAQELHDGIGPLLSAAKLYFQTYVNTDKQKLKEEIKTQMVETLNDTISQVSLVSNNLSPHILNDFGLKAAIQRLLDKLKPVSDIMYTFEYKIDREIKKEYEITLYRVTAELINNTIKHARATKIEVIIENRTDAIRLLFRNDGAPFDFERMKQQKVGMGLFNVMNRIHSLGGKVEFRSGTEQGIEYQVFLLL